MQLSYVQLARGRRLLPFLLLLDDDVVAGCRVQPILPGAADQHVVARASGEGVVALTANGDVIAIVAVCLEEDRIGLQTRRLHHIVAG